MINFILIVHNKEVPKFCPLCGKELVSSPNLEAYSHRVIGYMYHCQDCGLQISVSDYEQVRKHGI